MPYSPEHKLNSRDKILQSAIACFARQGYENTSIDEIMRQAEMTRGAFYAHFSSKSELYRQALLTGARNSQLVQVKPDSLSDKEWVDYLVKGYLSEHHIQQKSPPCPLAFLVTDVAVNAPEVRHTYTRIFKDMNKMIHAMTRSFSDCEQEQIYAITAMMIGAVAIGRTLDSAQTRNKMLRACENLALHVLNGGLGNADEHRSSSAEVG